MKLPVIMFLATFAFVLSMIAEGYALHRLTADLGAAKCDSEEVVSIGN